MTFGDANELVQEIRGQELILAKRHKQFSKSHLNQNHFWFLFLFVAIVLSVFILVACGQSPSTSVSIPSPDGSLLLKSSINQNAADPAGYLRVVVEIKDLYGNRVFHETTPASDTMRWSLRWVSNHEVLLDSADIGRYVIRRVDNKQWVGGYEKANPQT